eukprot:6746885-Alexandrium_andersonii.AAC.1
MCIRDSLRREQPHQEGSRNPPEPPPTGAPAAFASGLTRAPPTPDTSTGASGARRRCGSGGPDG